MPPWAFKILDPYLPYQPHNCKNLSDFGTLTFVINGIDYDLPSTHFMQRFTDVFEKGDGYCINNIIPMDIPPANMKAYLFILGDVFM
jgi:hypothetical protein